MLNQEQLIAALQTKTVEELKRIRFSIHRTLAKGRSPTGMGYRADEEFVIAIRQVLEEKEAEGTPRSSEQSLEAQAQQLAKEHPGTSIEVAKKYLERKEKERNGLDTVRTKRQAAPAPEPATPEESWEDERSDLRSNRMRGK